MRDFGEYLRAYRAYVLANLGIALDLAQAALADCRQRGYQVAVAVVDRSGLMQVVLRDRFAGPHTPPTASGKAWTAATFMSRTFGPIGLEATRITFSRGRYPWS
jgi:uncharacterized protein GlcG (DUF336 family)